MHFRSAGLLVLASILSAPVSAKDAKGPSTASGTGVTASSFVARTQGVYRHYRRVREKLETYDGEDIMEVVPYGRGEAYIRMRTVHGNYHVCILHGIFRAEADAYVYERSDPDPKGLSCRMRIALKGRAFAMSVIDTRTGDNLQACLGSCGARGSFDGQDGFALRQRRPIRYMDSLLASDEYRAAVDQRGGKPATPGIDRAPDQDARPAQKP